MVKTSACLCFALIFVGCGVSKELYLQKEAELATCRTTVASGEGDLKQCREQAELRQQELEAEKKRQVQAGVELEECRKLGPPEAAACREAAAKAEAELESARGDASSRTAELENARKEIEGLRAQEAELRSRLEKEIHDQTVEVERLRAKLSVHVVDQILFDSGREEIKKEGKEVLDKVAAVVAGSKEMVRVEGHADGTPVSKRLKGRFYSNWELSAARAANVVRYFQYGKGIDPARMEAVGVAQYRPVVPDDTFEGRAQNRRVVIILTPAR